MSEQKSSSSVGFGGLLALLFIALKLIHVIDWSWWWVLSPLWVVLALLGLGLVVSVLIFIAIAVWEFFRK